MGHFDVKFLKLPSKVRKLTNFLIVVVKVVDAQPKSRMWYRIGASRNLTGGRKITPTGQMNEKIKKVRKIVKK